MKAPYSFEASVGKYRIRHGELATSKLDGRNGAFSIPISFGKRAFCICSDGMGWDHVSARVVVGKSERAPYWAEMCKIKDLFFDESECVVQFHPPRSEYVNTHPNVLHLWRNQQAIHQTPPICMV